jgi:hypothetical protein
MKSIKRLQFDYLAYRIERDNDFALDTVKDNIYITQILITSYFLKTFKLFMFVIGLCYFLSILFVVLMNIESDLLHDDPDFLENNCENDGAYGYFYLCYGLESDSNYEYALKMYYFGFTTLSTVGFGDFHPKSNAERVFIGFCLLFGVAIFSTIMGNFLEIIDSFKEFDADIDEGHNLIRFFNIL